MMETAGASDQVLKFLGPLVISEAELNEGFEILTDAILAAVAVFEKTGRTPCAA
jgi:diaminobutyrate-2-oxoglutarate transaminase